MNSRNSSQKATFFLTLSDALVSLESNEQLADALFDALSAILPIDALGLVEVTPEVFNHAYLRGYFSHFHPSEEFLDEYKTHYSDSDPMRRMAYRLPAGKTAVIEEVIDKANQAHLDVWALFQNEFGFTDALIAKCSESPNGQFIMNLFRKNGQDFSRDEREMLEGILPFIAKNILALLDYERMKLAQKGLERLFHYYYLAGFIIEENGLMLYNSPNFYNFLRPHVEGFTLGAYGLPSPLSDWLDTLQYPDEKSPLMQSPQFFHMKTKAGGLRAIARMIHVIDRPCLLLGTQSAMKRISFAPLIKRGLTKKEIEVLEYVPDGLTSVEIGEKLHCSEITIKKHLQSAAEKLGTIGRNETAFEALKLVQELVS